MNSLGEKLKISSSRAKYWVGKGVYIEEEQEAVGVRNQENRPSVARKELPNVVRV
jgi:hypothetical protein